nr:helix-turn-helix transcriptional regulator [Microvirga lupini]
MLGTPLLEALNRMCYGGIVLDAAGEVLTINQAAIRLLQEKLPNNHQHDYPNWREALKVLLRSQTSVRLTLQEQAWVVVRRDMAGQKPLVLHAVPLGSHVEPGPSTIIILIDLDDTPRPTGEALQKIFGLTPTEAKLALNIACGQSLDEIAKDYNISIATARKHLASIFAKTRTNRQADLMALLARVSILP